VLHVGGGKILFRSVYSIFEWTLTAVSRQLLSDLFIAQQPEENLHVVSVEILCIELADMVVCAHQKVLTLQLMPLYYWCPSLYTQ
jgi:hypothetical protein